MGMFRRFDFLQPRVQEDVVGKIMDYLVEYKKDEDQGEGNLPLRKENIPEGIEFVKAGKHIIPKIKKDYCKRSRELDVRIGEPNGDVYGEKRFKPIHKC